MATTGTSRTAVPREPRRPKATTPIMGPRARPTVPPVTYTDIAVLLRWSGRSLRTVRAPSGWKKPEPRPEKAAMATRTGKVGAKPTAPKVTAVQSNAAPVNRVP